MRKVKQGIRFDAGSIDRIIETREGFLKGDSVITRTGVFTYVNQDGTLRKELRHPDDVFSLDSLNSLEMIPITNDHPSVMIDSNNVKRLSVGTTGENVRPDGKYLVSSVIITDQVAIDAVNSGKRQLSLGYTVDLKKDAGEYDGERYDYRQTNIRYNHLALVTTARAGSNAKLKFDSVDCDFAIELKNNIKNNTNKDSLKNKEKIMSIENMVKVDCGDGLNYDSSPEVANKVKNLSRKNTVVTQKYDAAVVNVDGLKKTIATLTAERDDVKEKFEKLEKLDNSDAVKVAAKEMIRLNFVADAILDDEAKKKLDTMSNAEIKKACVLVKYPSIKEDADDAYITARFDILCEELDSGGNKDKNINTQRAKSASRFNSDSSKVIDSEKARVDAFKELQESCENYGKDKK